MNGLTIGRADARDAEEIYALYHSLVDAPYGHMER